MQQAVLQLHPEVLIQQYPGTCHVCCQLVAEGGWIAGTYHMHLELGSEASAKLTSLQANNPWQHCCMLAEFVKASKVLNT